MTTPNLAIAHVAAAQNQKEVTINDALDRLDLAMNDTIDIDCDAGNTSVPAGAYRENFLLRLTGAPAADFTLTLPDGKRVVAVHNTTTRLATLRTETPGMTLVLRANELVLLGSRGTDLVALAASAVGGIADISLFVSGKPSAGARVHHFVFPRAVSLPAGLVGSVARAAIAPAAAASFALRRNGSAIGSISFAAGQATATFVLAGGAGFVSGDRLEVMAPAVQDATLADIAVSLVGSRP